MRRRGPVSFFNEDVTRVGDGRMIVPFGETYIDKVRDYHPTQYLPLYEASGAVAADRSGNSYDGAYTDVTLGVTGIGDGETAARFAAGSGVVDRYSAGYAAAYNPNEGSYLVWFKVAAAGVWTDGTLRYLFDEYSDADEFVLTYKHSVNNQLVVSRRSGADSISHIIAGLSAVTWQCLVITVSVDAGELHVYLNGVEDAPADAPSVDITTALASTRCVLAARDVNAVSDWQGDIAHFAHFGGVILSAADAADLYVVP